MNTSRMPERREMIRTAIIGCGLIGQKRAKSLGRSSLAMCCDQNPERAAALASKYSGAKATVHWEEAVVHPDVDVVIVSTSHDALAVVAERAAAAGKHVLIEKPGARRAAELDAVISAAKRSGVCVRVGFNHRYHPAICKAREIVDSGAIGPLMFLRGRYGHGGRPGYDREWRAVPEISGGGEAIDQGMHLIDLARWFLGDFSVVQGFTHTYFWDMPVEDNAFFLLRTPGNHVAFLHATWTEWKNLFSLEIYGRQGKLEVTGLGGSYGTERLAHYQMRPEMGPPDTVIYEYPQSDASWNLEFAEFLDDIRLGRESRPGLADAQAALRIIEQVYEASRL
jgi:predicted dehydrogenase